MFFGTPKRSMTCSAFGSAASELAVVSAMRHGSRTAFRNERNDTPTSNDTPAITIPMKSARPTYISATTLPSVRRMARPLLPTVAAMAANTPIGANTITYDVNVNITCAVLSNTASTGRPAGPRAASATPKNVANTTTCRMSPRAIASTTDVGNRCRKMSQALWLFFAMAATVDGVSRRHGDAGARLEDVGEPQADGQGDGGGDLEVDDRLEADAPQRLQVAGAGDAGDERRKEKRRDDHLDHPQKRIGQRLDRNPRARPDGSEDRARDEADEDLRRERRAPAGGGLRDRRARALRRSGCRSGDHTPTLRRT